MFNDFKNRLQTDENNMRSILRDLKTSETACKQDVMHLLTD